MTDRATRKIRRNPRACDVCSHRSVRCVSSRTEIRKCQNCLDYGENCTFNRPLRKRGAKPKRRPSAANLSPSNEPQLIIPDTQGRLRPARPSVEPVSPPELMSGEQDLWHSNIFISQAVVMDLTEIYFEVVYPVFPFFHRPTLVRRVSRGEHLTNRTFFATVMAMCALSSARARDGALYSARWDVQSLREPSSEAIFRAAEDAIPRDATLTQDFDYMRACVLLAITSIQYGRTSLMSHYLGLYNTFVAVGRLHDETNWPKDLTIIETEERRRLFWSTYTLDVFTSVIWSGVARSREASSNVAYPTEVDDEAFSNAGYSETVEPSKVNWLQGWNFVTDLYRILEHSVDHLRSVRVSADRSSFTQAFIRGSLKQMPVLDHVNAMYASLPDQFKFTGQVTCRLSEDLFSFQAANIAATVQLVRMVYFANDQSTLEKKCQVAGEVISGFASVPVAYLRAISSPLLHHLAGIGTILGAAFDEGMTESSYREVRSVLLDLANLLSSLEVDLYCPSETSKKLRTQVSRIDEFMKAQPLSSGFHEPTSYATQISTTPDDPASERFQDVRRPATTTESPQYHFPPELFEDWSWALNLTAS